jgi:hypothetical protein
LSVLLDEVDEDPQDTEHVGASLTHESGWCVGVYPGWRITLEHLDDLDIQPRHLDVGSVREAVLKLMRAVAEGNLEHVVPHDWQPGY